MARVVAGILAVLYLGFAWMGAQIYNNDREDIWMLGIIFVCVAFTVFAALYALGCWKEEKAP
jgi:hypothetical protein